MLVPCRHSPVPLVLIATIATGGLAAACSGASDDGSASVPPAPSSSATPAGSASSRPTPAHTSAPGYGSAPELPPRCTSFTYGDWSTCRADETQTRAVVTSLPAGCLGGNPDVTAPCDFTVPADGYGLYEAYCAGCHGDSRKGSSADAITDAIAEDRGGMAVLKILTTDQIKLIAGIESGHPR